MMIKAKTFVPSVLILIYFAFIASCQKTQPSLSSNIKGIWSVSSIADSVSSGPFPSAYPITMRIVTDTIYISTPANGYSFSYTIYYNEGLYLKGIVGTDVAAANYQVWEDRLIQLLQKTASFKRSGDTLIFNTSNARYNIHFIKHPPIPHAN